MVMFRNEFNKVFDVRWEEHRKTLPQGQENRYIAAYRNKVAKEMYEAAPAEVKKCVDEERMKGKKKKVLESESSEEDVEEEAEMESTAKEAKQVEKRLRADREQAQEYQQ